MTVQKETASGQTTALDRLESDVRASLADADQRAKDNPGESSYWRAVSDAYRAVITTMIPTAKAERTEMPDQTVPPLFGSDKTTIPVPIIALLRDAANLLDTAFCFSDDERLDRRYTETRDKIREALKGRRAAKNRAAKALAAAAAPAEDDAA
jgi:hypothetical protein